MAADLPGADALLDAARASGAPLMINWPTAWRPALRHGLGLVESGAVGEPVQLSHRGGHAGPKEYGCSTQFCDWLYDPRRNGAGALVDYCGYGAILARSVLGRPQSVTAVAAHLRKEGLPSEDNAVVVLRYARALAVLEGSWTQIGGEPGFAVIVYGDAGTLLVHQPRAVREGQAVGSGRVQLVTGADSRMIDPPPLPADERDGVTYFLSRIRDGRPIDGLCTAIVGRDAQEILAAALESTATARTIALPAA
jgi:predicted dehydrogenase